MDPWSKQRLKKSDTIVALYRSFVRSYRRYTNLAHGHEIRLMDELGVFAPNSSGNISERTQMTLQAAAQTFPLIVQLLKSEGAQSKIISVREFMEQVCPTADVGRLKALFDKHGSDKSTYHDFHYLYAAALADPNAPIDLLEIGLGTDNTDVVSNMGWSGVPGASLRAFKEFLPRSRIYGADVDRRILFEEERIKTFFVDQTDAASFDTISHAVGHPFDVIIDDGLHAPHANLITLSFALQNLKAGGWCIIEDIGPPSVPVWQVVGMLLSRWHECWLVSAQDAHLFVVRKRVQVTT